MRTTCFTNRSTVEMIAASVDEYLQNKAVQFVIRQRSSRPNEIILVCTPTSRLERTAQQLVDMGYHDGPRPSREIYMHEGQKLWVHFRGNIQGTTEDGGPLRPSPVQFLYNSQMPPSTEVRVRQVDEFAQRCINVYRGFVQLFTEQLVLRPCPTDADKSSSTRIGGERQKNKEAQKMEWVMGDKLLAEMVITLPKVYNDVLS